MGRRLIDPVATWATLLVLTGLSYLSWLDTHWANPRLIGSIVIVIALVKAWLIGMRFMEIGEAIRPIRLIFNLWVLTVGGVLIAMFGAAP